MKEIEVNGGDTIVMPSLVRQLLLVVEIYKSGDGRHNGGILFIGIMRVN
jgi:hypothetical protein